jgi:hypothetical protein
MMKAWHYMTNEDVRNLAEQALDEACKHIQDVIGVQSGDVAGIYFSGNNKDAIEAVLMRYINLELSFRDSEIKELLGENNNAAQ